jgi:hypothetical protein
VHLLPAEMRLDVEKIILTNLRGFEEMIFKRTKKVDGQMNETAFDTYLWGMSAKQINYNT